MTSNRRWRSSRTTGSATSRPRLTTRRLIRPRWPAAIAAASLASCFTARLHAAPAADAGSGPELRVPWTTSRIAGSPEPPPPYRLERVFPRLRFTNIVDLAHTPALDRWFVLEQGGRLSAVQPGADTESAEVILDLRPRAPDFNAAYGLTFHPGFATNRFLYVCYVRRDGLPDGSRVSRFKMISLDPPRIDPESETIVLTWLSGGHNGGCLKFGPEGYLYISTGDGAGPNPPDPLDTGQDNRDLLAAVLRIDVDAPEPGKAYRVPPDNPFVGTPDCRPEIWAYGLRNPWKMAFDPRTGALWLADVGWELWEMVYRIERGGNYGWSIVEGPQSVHPAGRRGPTPILPPVVAHPHSEAASITGGLVYRGRRLPELTGAYVYGDWVTGKVWALWHDGQSITKHEEIARSRLQIVCFGEDNDGELYVADYAAGGLYRLAPNPDRSRTASFPQTLGETGLFASTADHTPAPGVVPFFINAEMWADGAVAERWVALPGRSLIQTGAKDVWIYQSGPAWKFPTNAVLAKTLSLESHSGQPQSRRRVETQILHFDGAEWHGYTYRWNDAQTDATLVPAEGAEQEFEVQDPAAPGGRRRLRWRFHSRTECLRCHNSWVNYALAFTAPQLNRDVLYQANRPLGLGAAAPFHAAAPQQSPAPIVAANQLRALSRAGFFDQPLDERARPKLTNPYLAGTAAGGGSTPPSLNERARSWLHVNCAHCHREGAGGSVVTHLDYESTPDQMKAFGRPPSQGAFGIEDAAVIQPGDPYRSVLYFRIATEGGGHMPRLGARRVDPTGVRLIHDWIQELPAAGARDSAARSDPAPLRAAHEAWLNELARLPTHPSPRAGAIVERLLATTSGALALWHHLSERGSAELRTAVAAKAAAHESVAVRELFENFLPDDQRPDKLGAAFDAAALLQLPGDADSGRRIFFQPGGPQCAQCHRVHGEGRDFGPDLSHIASRYTRAQLLDHIVQPSKFIDPAFVAYVAETNDDETYSGLLVRQTPEEVVLKDANAREIHLRKTALQSLQAQQLSAMPEGLLANLTAPAVADLLEYLCTLK